MGAERTDGSEQARVLGARVRQLECAFEVLEGRRTHARVQVGDYRPGIRQAEVTVAGMGPVLLVQQNPTTKSIFARAQRAGARIAWVMQEPGVYLFGLTVADLGDGPRVYTKSQLAQAIHRRFPGRRQ